MTAIASGPGLAAYGAAKAALISLCQSIGAEESPAGITATAIAPGCVDTEMSTWVHDPIDPGQMISPGEIAELILTLAQLSARSLIPADRHVSHWPQPVASLMPCVQGSPKISTDADAPRKVCGIGGSRAWPLGTRRTR